MISVLFNGRFQDYYNPEMYGKASLIFADLPYGVTHLDYDRNPDPISDFWDFCKKYLSPSGVVVCTGVLKFAVKLMETAPKGWFRYDMVWEKAQATGHLNARKMPLRAHEMILVFSPSGKTTYNPQMTHGHKRKQSSAEAKSKCSTGSVYGKQKSLTSYDSTDRYPRSVVKFPTDRQRSYIHPNQKPVALLEWIVRTFTNEGDVVMDPVAGSGTTAVAALNAGNRGYVMIEQDKEFFDKMKDRISGKSEC